MPTYKANEPKQAAVYFVEPGIYEVEIKKAVEKISEKGNPTIKLDVEIVMPDGSVGPKMWEHLVFTAKAAWKIDQVLAAIGRAVIPGEDINVEPEDLLGQRAVCMIGEEPGQTNPDHRFNKIERWIFGDEKTRWISDQKKNKHIVDKSNGYVKQPKDQDGDDIPF